MRLNRKYRRKKICAKKKSDPICFSMPSSVGGCKWWLAGPRASCKRGSNAATASCILPSSIPNPLQLPAPAEMHRINRAAATATATVYSRLFPAVAHSIYVRRVEAHTICNWPVYSRVKLPLHTRTHAVEHSNPFRIRLASTRGQLSACRKFYCTRHSAATTTTTNQMR